MCTMDALADSFMRLLATSRREKVLFIGTSSVTLALNAFTAACVDVVLRAAACVNESDHVESRKREPKLTKA